MRLLQLSGSRNALARQHFSHRYCPLHTRPLISSSTRSLPSGRDAFANASRRTGTSDFVLRELDLSNSPPKLYDSKSSILGRSVLLTGGTSGIGYSIAQLLLLQGAGRVVIVTRNAERGVNAIRRLTGSHPSLEKAPLTVLVADLSNEEMLAERVGPVMREMHCDTLIACGGISQTSPLVSTSRVTSDEILSTNLASTISLGKLFLKHYLRRKQQTTPSGELSRRLTRSLCFVSVSSLLALRGGVGASTYAASKAGIIAYTRALALEAAASYKRGRSSLPPFRANVVLPGYVDTAMTSSFRPEYVQELRQQIPLDRFATGDEVANAVAFLLQNEYANNTVLNLDGGLSGV
jgi:NAD(P)-dependent dehydrogenase (short-subunit alcohol dehydrogenase family)